MEWEEETLNMVKRYIPQEKIIALTGNSGSGKTRFLESMYKKYRWIYPIKLMKQDVIMYPCLTVLETLCFYCPHLKETDVMEFLEKTRLGHLRDVKIGSFDDKKISGGEKKRIFLCYMLLDPSPVIICDEPFSGLDEQNINLFFDRMVESKKTIVFSFHQNLLNIVNRVDELREIDEDRINFFENEFTEIPLVETTSRQTLQTDQNYQRKNIMKRELLIIRKEPLNHLSKFMTPIFTILMQNIIIGSVFNYYRAWVTTKNDFYFYDLVLVYICNLFTCSISPLSSLTNHQRKYYMINHEIEQGIYHQKEYAFAILVLETLFYLISCIMISLISCRTTHLLWIYLLNTFAVTMFSDYFLWFLTFRFPRVPILIMFILIIYISFSFVINFGFIIYYKNIVTRYAQYFSVIHQQTNIFMEYLHENRIVRDSLALLNLNKRLDITWWFVISCSSFLFFPLLILIF